VVDDLLFLPQFPPLSSCRVWLSFSSLFISFSPPLPFSALSRSMSLVSPNNYWFNIGLSLFLDFSSSLTTSPCRLRGLRVAVFRVPFRSCSGIYLYICFIHVLSGCPLFLMVRPVSLDYDTPLLPSPSHPFFFFTLLSVFALFFASLIRKAVLLILSGVSLFLGSCPGAVLPCY